MAYRVGLDPLQVRLLNYAGVDPSSGQPWSSKSLQINPATGESFADLMRRAKAR